MVVPTRYRKLVFILAILLIAGVILSVYRGIRLKVLESEIRTTIAQIKDAYGIDIHYRYDAKSFFPQEYLYLPVSAQGSQVSLKHVKSILPIIETFLSKYPREVIWKNLSDIYLLGKLEFYGRSYGGTYINSAIYIQSQGTNDSLVGIMHAEFSSILFHNYEFPKEKWEAANESGWKYTGTGFEILGRKDSYDLSEELFSKGFLVKYSQSSLENDFNMFVQWAFLEPPILQNLASKYERINKKYQLMIQFYKSIDPRINIPSM